jgi:hypothetical protein
MDAVKTSIVYEFHGSQWHGDTAVYQRGKMLLSKTAGQLYDEIIERENIIKSLGYNLVVMWESEWNGMNGSQAAVLQVPTARQLRRRNQCA